MPTSESFPALRDRVASARNFELYDGDAPRGLGITGPDTVEYQEILALRDRFVTGMGWLKDIERLDDRDRYDEEMAGSLHFYTKNDSGLLEASMRLTPVVSIDKSLSVEMLVNSPEALEGYCQYRAELHALCKRGNMWDLTRMVHPLDGSVEPEAIMAGMVKMIGAGINACQTRHATEPPVWIFTTTIAMEQALNNLGIKHDIVAGGKLSADDNEDSLFCVAKPHDALYYVQDNPQEYAFTVRHVSDGLRLRSCSL